MIVIRLKEALNKLDITQVEISKATGIRAASVSNMVNNSNNLLDLSNFDKIAGYLIGKGAKFEDLISYIPNEKMKRVIIKDGQMYVVDPADIDNN